jgi:site-specific recombinase XerC
VRHTHCRAGIGRINALFVKKSSIDGPGNCQSRMLFDWMVVGGILEMNPAASVRGPKYVIKKGKTPVLTPEEARLLLDSIDVTELFACAIAPCSP